MRGRHIATIALLVVITLLASACQSTPASPTPTAAKPAATAAAQATAAPAATSAAAAKPQATTAAAATKPAASPQAALDPCALLTPADVQSVLGKAVTAKAVVSTPEAADCEYFEGNTNNKLAGYVVYPLTPSQAQGVHEATKGGGREQVAVPGLGDDAYWDKTLGGTLHVLKGRYALSLSVVADAAADPLKASQTLAAKVLNNLP